MVRWSVSTIWCLAVFMDASGNMDWQNSGVFLLMTHWQVCHSVYCTVHFRQKTENLFVREQLLTESALDDIDCLFCAIQTRYWLIDWLIDWLLDCVQWAVCHHHCHPAGLHNNAWRSTCSSTRHLHNGWFNCSVDRTPCSLSAVNFAAVLYMYQVYITM